MTINWITVSAQVVNFLILVWILKRLLYEPVMRAMTAREQRIADQLQEAVRREQAADTAAAELAAARQQVTNEREQILADASATAEAERKRLLEEARTEVAESRARWLGQVEAEKGEFLARLERQILLAVNAIAHKALSDLADDELEARTIAAFERRLADLDGGTRDILAAAGRPVEVITAFEPGLEHRARITRAVRQALGADVQLEFRQSSELISGIHLVSGGYKLGWSMSDYLDELGDHVESVLSQAGRSFEARTGAS